MRSKWGFLIVHLDNMPISPFNFFLTFYLFTYLSVYLFYLFFYFESIQHLALPFNTFLFFLVCSTARGCDGWCGEQHHVGRWAGPVAGAEGSQSLQSNCAVPAAHCHTPPGQRGSRVLHSKCNLVLGPWEDLIMSTLTSRGLFSPPQHGAAV